ncbi:MAG: PAS domain S-box protein [Opitutaceae bacterium]|nr:PAS domain S-box protein [Opitutaceae bacterium]
MSSHLSARPLLAPYAELDLLRTKLAAAEAQLRELRAAAAANDTDARESAMYRTLVEESGQGAALIAADGAILYANVRLAQWLGVSREDAIGLSLAECIPPAQQMIFSTMLHPGPTGRSVGELSVGRASGGGRALFFTFVALPEGAGAAFAVTAADLTERQERDQLLRTQAEMEARVAERTRALADANAANEEARIAALNLMDDAVEAQHRAERALAQLEQEMAGRRRSEESLKRSHHWLENAERIAAFGCWAIDLEKKTVWASSEAARIYGLPDRRECAYDEIVGVPLPEYRAVLDAAIANLIERGEPYRVEYRICRPCDGVVADVLGVAEYDAARRTLYGIVRDVTEEKRAAAALRTSEQNYAEIFNATGEAFIIYDAEDGAILDVNQAMLTMYGYSNKAEARRHGPASFHLAVSGEASEEIARRFEATKAGEDQVFEFISHRGDGAPFWSEISLRQAKIGGRACVLSVVRDIEQRKLAECALRASEVRIRSLFESMSEIVAIHELVLDEAGQPSDYRILDVNEAYETQLNLTKPQVVGKLASEVYPGGRSPFLETYGRVALTGERVTFEAYVEPMGRHFHISAFSPERGRFVSVATDVTAQCEAARVLQASEERFMRFMKHLPGIAYIKDAHRRLLYINERFASELGLGREQVLGRMSEEVWPGTESERIRSDDECVLAEKKPLLVIEELEGRSGRHTYQTVKFPILQGDATLLGGISLDVTELAEAEEALSLANRELATLNHMILDCAGALNLPSILERMLAYAAQISGLEGGAICLLEEGRLRRKVSRGGEPGSSGSGPCFCESLCSKCVQEVRPLIFEGRAQIAACAELEATGSSLEFLAAFPLVAREKCLGGLCVFSHNARGSSARSLKLLETATGQIALAVENALLFAETRRYAAEMDGLVRARTAELEATNQELEAFSYSISHDLRAPLRAVDGFSRMLEEKCGAALDAEGRRLLGVVRGETQHMAALIDNLLAFARLGRAAMSPRLLDMHALVGEVWAEIRASEPARVAELETGELPPALADGPLLRQVWVNLLGNAFKYTRRRVQAKIVITGERAGQETVYHIADNGVGFDMRYADQLFTVFHRLHRDEEFEGTGVGLALAQRIVRRHGGRIWAEGAVDQGATFHLALPAATATVSRQPFPLQP